MRTSLLPALAVLFVVGSSDAEAPVGACHEIDHGASSDLYCVTLVPTAGYPAATGRAHLLPPASPFGVSVTAEGVHRYDLEFLIAGLPEASAAGGHRFVAWATTPLFRPMVRLGEVANGTNRLGPVALNKFILIVSLEAGDAEGEMPGELVLRGTSPSMMLQPDELPALLSAAAERARRPEGDAWPVPPRHRGVPMLAGLAAIRPDVAPLRPGADAIAPARPRQGLSLADGDTLTLVAGPVLRRVGDRTLAMYGFNGQIPGPLLRVEQASTIEIRLVNDLELPTTVHWHGLRLENRFDGVPNVTQPLVPPGGEFRYRLRFPDAGLYWYHPHHREDIIQDLGLYGGILVDPTADDLAPVDREEHLMLDDLLVGPEDVIPFGDEAATHALMGRFGNLLLINGGPAYEVTVDAGAVVRFYLTNASNTRTFNLSFGERPIRIVAADIGRFERETWAESVVIAPAQRYIVEVRFDRAGVVPLLNRIQSIDHLGGAFFAEVDTLGAVRVTASGKGNRTGEQRALRVRPDVSAEIDRYRGAAASPPDAELLLTVDAVGLPFPIGPLMALERDYFNPVEWSGTMGRMNWLTTTGAVKWSLRDAATGLENLDIDWRFRVGDVVKVRLRNDRDAFHAMQHPIHLHGQRVLVIARNGVPQENLAWKDTVLVPAGATADILIEFSNPGQWMLHCHIAEHLEAGMKTIFNVEGAE